MELVQSERLIGADQMHAVAAVGKRFRQLGRDDAAAAHGCVTQNAYVHGILPGFAARCSSLENRR
jgi:hypothetical protein